MASDSVIQASSDGGDVASCILLPISLTESLVVAFYNYYIMFSICLIRLTHVVCTCIVA